MRLDLFERLAPLCPRCLHGEGRHSALVIADRAEMRDGRLWHGILHCANSACWMEFPVIDGIPIITADPRATLQGAETQILARSDLPETSLSQLGDAFGPGSAFESMRQHLSIYAGEHFPEFTDPPGAASSVAAATAAGLALIPEPPEGPALDIGGGPGRGGWEVALATGRPVLSYDLNFAFLRIAQQLALNGEAVFPFRRVGLVYDRRTIRLPETFAAARIDFWALDAMALPFPPGHFALLAGLNVVDCVSAPAQLLAEAGRVASPGAAAFFTTPFDWSPTVAQTDQWLGGHSQRSPQHGMSEPVLRATLDQAGFDTVAEADDLPWTLRLHDRSVMHYRLHLAACRRRA